MRSPAVLSFLFGMFGVVLGACDDGDDDGHDHSECAEEDVARADTIASLTADETAGATVFSQTCGNAGCHGADGNSGPGANLSEHVQHYDAEALTCLVLAGNGDMPSQAGLTDQQLADVVAYVEATF